MRFFEFKLPEPGTSLADKIKSDLESITANVEKNPEVEQLVNKQLEKLLQQADQALDQAKTNAAAKPAKPAPSGAPVAKPTQLSTPPTESLDEDTATYSLIDELNEKIDQICAAIQNCDPIIQPIKDTISNLRLQIEKSLASAVQQGKETRDIEIQRFFSGLEDQLKQLAAKAAPDSKTLKEIVIRFKSSFSDTILRDRKITQQDFSDFLNDAINGKVVDMAALVKTEKGNIANFVKDSKHKVIFDIIKDDIFGYVPGGTGANMGPGEVALTMFGNPIKKGEVGDLDVDGVMYEVKGGRTRGKESGYGGRLNGKRVQKPTSGFKIINDFFKEKLPNIPSTTESKTGKAISRFNWNTKGIENLNYVFSQGVPEQSRAELMKELMYRLWSGLITNHEDIKNFEARIDSMVDLEGRMDPSAAIRITTELLYDSYALSDGEKVKGKPVFNIIVLNAGSLNYQIIRSAKDIGKAQIVGGISWTDANQSTSPQLFVL